MGYLADHVGSSQQVKKVHEFVTNVLAESTSNANDKNKPIPVTDPRKEWRTAKAETAVAEKELHNVEAKSCSLASKLETAIENMAKLQASIDESQTELAKAQEKHDAAHQTLRALDSPASIAQSSHPVVANQQQPAQSGKQSVMERLANAISSSYLDSMDDPDDDEAMCVEDFEMLDGIDADTTLEQLEETVKEVSEKAVREARKFKLVAKMVKVKKAGKPTKNHQPLMKPKR